MKLYTFLHKGVERLGAETSDGRLLDLAGAAHIINGAGNHAFASMQSLIQVGESGLEAATNLLADFPEESLVNWRSIKILAPLPRPSKIRDFSSFERHLLQATDGAAFMLAAEKPDPAAAYVEMRRKFNLDSLPGSGWSDVPGYYYSDATTIVGHDEEVSWPGYSDWIDYELELAAVIGKAGKDIARENADEYIFGYTLFNDLSARDAQFVAMSTGLGVAKGKDFDGSNVIGPCIVTRDEIPDPYAMTMRAFVNEELWSLSFLREAKWRFDDCIAYASQSQTLVPGELFCTGAAADGCGLEHRNKLNRGDVVILSADPIGALRTRII
ncbi:fumarylacetoacetate hydrolase family protein [Kineobactrum salinum]|uniref:Fumarylacetoacetate hydrolase family protein n=1 Tax=Kineobactrum salinum TaxID=2708301 RepID=A0A6C0U3R7_9GAMM|nr:fumarylacetoacetate hydrolase family protein [Kineobactrum salinum]QIB65627.1 fumarylacetoacetate hydrolase family protein [Kineobactrum salinum]